MKIRKISTKSEIKGIRLINKSMIMLVLSVVLIAGSIFYIVESSSLGSRLAKVEQKEEILSQEKRDLSDQLANLDSLTNISARQTELSFVKPTKVIYLKPEENVAKAF